MQISIFGLGMVGAVTAGCLVTQGHEVIAFDANADRTDLLRSGLAPVKEPGLDRLIAAAADTGHLRTAADAAEAVAISALSVICVEDAAELARLCDAIGAALKRKAKFHAIAQRGAVRPGAIRGTVIPALERASGKRAGTDFGVAVYPDFLRRGNAIEDYINPPAIILGVTDDETLARLREMDIALQAPEMVIAIEDAETMAQLGRRRAEAARPEASPVSSWPSFPLVADGLRSR